MAARGRAVTGSHTMRFVYSEAVRRALHRRYRNAQSTTSNPFQQALARHLSQLGVAIDADAAAPPANSAATTAGGHSPSPVKGKTAAMSAGSEPASSSSSARQQDSLADCEIPNLAEIYAEILRMIDEADARAAAPAAAVVGSKSRRSTLAGAARRRDDRLAVPSTTAGSKNSAAAMDDKTGMKRPADHVTDHVSTGEKATSVGSNDRNKFQKSMTKVRFADTRTVE